MGRWGGWLPNRAIPPPKKNHPENRLFWPEFHLLYSQYSKKPWGGFTHLGKLSQKKNVFLGPFLSLQRSFIEMAISSHQFTEVQTDIVLSRLRKIQMWQITIHIASHNEYWSIDPDRNTWFTPLEENKVQLKSFGLAAALSVKLAHSHLLSSASAVALHISTLFASRNAVFALFCVYHPFVKVALFWQYEQ